MKKILHQLKKFYKLAKKKKKKKVTNALSNVKGELEMVREERPKVKKRFNLHII